MTTLKPWIAACDLIEESLMNLPENRYRAVIRDEKCCHQLDEIKKELLRELGSIREYIKQNQHLLPY